jgi:hypothetical protein
MHYLVAHEHVRCDLATVAAIKLADVADVRHPSPFLSSLGRRAFRLALQRL